MINNVGSLACQLASKLHGNLLPCQYSCHSQGLDYSVGVYVKCTVHKNFGYLDLQLIFVTNLFGIYGLVLSMDLFCRILI